MRKHAIVVESESIGNSGLHQSGFERYFRATLDCGHKYRGVWYQKGDTPDGRPVRFEKGRNSSFPEVGDECVCHVCQGGEWDDHHLVTRSVAWLNGYKKGFFGVANAVRRGLGLTDEEFYKTFPPENWPD